MMMSAPREHTTVTRMLSVRILRDLSPVNVKTDFQGVECLAEVRPTNKNILLHLVYLDL